ncbi:hypothetical protein J6590_024529 [Homalodisca vitripennis]|nr:hypothetical protein J6590_024529 [Homalodisca vitripennis]
MAVRVLRGRSGLAHVLGYGDPATSAPRVFEFEEPLSTDQMHGSDVSQDEDDFEDNVSAVSSELFGGYDSDMDSEYLPDIGNIIDQDQLNQPVQLPNILQEPESAIPQVNQDIQTNELGLIRENTNEDNLLSFQFNAPPLLSQEIQDTIESFST